MSGSLTLRFTVHGQTLAEILAKVDEHIETFDPGSSWEADVVASQADAVRTGAGETVSWQYEADVVARPSGPDR